MASEAFELRFGGGLDKEVEGYFGAVFAEMAFAVAGRDSAMFDTIFK
jgi:hypothetical protein